jgi:L-fuculose-phosphate aldolase
VTHAGERRELLAVARESIASGLVLPHGTSGNLSVRIARGFLITPTGIPFMTMGASDLVELSADGTPRRGQLVPSSEWRFHRDIYRTRPEAGAIVHAHSPFATVLACQRRSIPAVHYMIAAAGGDSVRCADYATFGTEELSRHAIAALAGRRACLLANHGMIAIGATLDAALTLAVEVENLAAQYWRILQLGRPVVLNKREMASVLEKFKTYGQQRARRRGRS